MSHLIAIVSYLRRYFLPGLLQVEAISLWLIRLRWMAIGCLLFLALCLDVFTQTALPARGLLCICFIIFCYNSIFFIFYKKLPNFPIYSTRFQIGLDWVALLFVIHFSGGILSPFIFFFILHVIINAIIFPQRNCYLYTLMSFVGLVLLYFIERYLFLSPSSLPGLENVTDHLGAITIFFIFLIFGFVLFIATFLATSIMDCFRERENEVRLLSQNLQKSFDRMEAIYEATKEMVSTNDMSTVLNLIVKVSVQMLHAKGGAIRVIETGGETLTETVSYGLSQKFMEKGPIKKEDGLFPKSTEDIILVDNVETDPRVKYRKEALKEGIHSIVSIPLVSKKTVRGDLRLYAETPFRFTNDEVSFLKILVSGAAVIVDNVQAWKRLEQNNSRIIQFAYRMSHDLKSPVVSIQSLLRAMQEGYAGDMSQKQREIINRCTKKLDQLLRLISDLLHLAEGGVLTDQHRTAPIYIEVVALEAVRLLEAFSKEKKISLHFTSPKRPIPFREISGDFHRLFFNLIDNAIRYTPEGGMVEIALSSDDESIFIRVRDTGMGIEPEHREYIFDEFYRTPKAKQKVQEGTGLGLCIVKAIVERYRGTISVESKPCTGTIFTIKLPRDKPM